MTYVPAFAERPTAAADEPQIRELAGTAVVRVLDYHCQPATQSPSANRHQAFTLTLVQDGAFCCRTGGRTYLLEPGAVLIGSPGDEYACSHDYGGDRCLVFQFSPAAAVSLAPDGIPAAAAIRSPGIDVLAARALTKQAQDAGSLEETALLLAAAALQTVTGQPPDSRQPPSARDRDRVHAGAAYLSRHFREPLNLAAVAAHTDTSPFHFLRTFRRLLGLTPHQYLVRARLRHAVELLLVTTRPVTDVAYEAGFGDLSHFHHTFRQHLGCTPQALRR